MKRGDMSMAVIIGAVIALLILVILSFLIFNALNKTKGGQLCESNGGTCVRVGVDGSVNCPATDPIRNPAYDCGKDEACCTTL